MRRIVFSLLAAVFLLSLSACSAPLTDQQRLAANGTFVYLSSDIFSGMEDAYEEARGGTACEPSILHAMEYRLDDLDGFSIHGILLTLRTDVLSDGKISDSTYLFIDLPSSTIYDDKALNFDTWKTDFGGTCRNGYDALALVFDRYAAYVQTGIGPMISDSESCTVFTQEDISIISQALIDKATAASNP